jgi:hypothetical protein
MAARQNPASRDQFMACNPDRHHFRPLLNGATRHAVVVLCYTPTSDELPGNPRNRLIDATK